MSRGRREFLTAGGTAAAGALAGCLDGLGTRRCEALGLRRPRRFDGSDVSLPVPESELLKAAEKDAIRAIVEPAFAPDWEDLDERLGEETGQELVDDDLVIGVERGGRARAYPLQVLWPHEVVNDDFGGPLVATYCPICGSSVTAERVVDGRATDFGVSGYLWRADLVMYDGLSDSLWSQILATAIRGPLVGETLELVPSTLTTWAAWRAEHPDTDVLLPPPLSSAVGTGAEDPYYLPYRSDQLFSDRGNGELDDHSLVQGVVVDGVARAYPYPAVAREQVINDRVNGHPVLVALGTGNRMLAYDRCVDGTALTFSPDGDGRARADGSRWQLDTGLAIDGPHEGERLQRLGGLPPMFWFAWADFHPGTDVYRGDGGGLQLPTFG